jgi:hypothetical protein
LQDLFKATSAFADIPCASRRVGEHEEKSCISKLDAEGSGLGSLGAHSKSLIFAVCEANRLIGHQSIGISEIVIEIFIRNG